MAIDRILSFLLRLGELAFAAIVAGITGQYLHDTQGVDSMTNARFIYTEVVAGLSIFLAIVWLFPFSGSFIHWPVDLLISICWFVAFGLLVNVSLPLHSAFCVHPLSDASANTKIQLIGDSCGAVFNWSNVAPGGDPCGKWKADIAFCFLSAIFWLVSALIGVFWVRDHTTTHAHTSSRRRWYRRSRV